MVCVQFNAKLLVKRREKRWWDVQLAKEASKAQKWIVEGGEKEEDEEVYFFSWLKWGVVGDKSGANEFLEKRRSNQKIGATSFAREVREIDEEDYKSDD